MRALRARICRLARELGTAIGVALILAGMLVLTITRASERAGGAELPANALVYAPVLAKRQAAAWPAAVEPWTLAGLVEQETCASLTSARCWSPRAELKTAREYGFGLGQVTIAYRANGSERFNKFVELRRQYASLAAWSWGERFNADYQLTAIVEMNRALWGRLPPAASVADQWAFDLVSYNGGLGGLLQDRRLCANSSGCDPARWFGHVETHSLKSKTPFGKGYGAQSPFSVTRGYVRNVLTLRRDKYRPFWN